MKGIVPTGDVSVLSTPVDIITHDKAIVKLDAGCVWAKLQNNGRIIGFAYTGSSDFVVDAISETRDGAWGDSVSGKLAGVQVFLGDVGIVSDSHVASIEDFRKLDYPDSNTFLDDIKKRLDDFASENKQVNVKHDLEDKILVGLTSEGKDVVIVAKDDGLVFTYDKQVFVDGKGNTVSVTKGGVGVHNRDGRSLVIDKHGIHGLEGLEELRDLGPSIKASVHSGLKGLKGIKTAKRHMKSGIKRARMHDRHYYDGYDDVDDLDWKDDE